MTTESRVAPVALIGPAPRLRLLPVAATVYVLAWLVGLATGPSGPGISAPGATVHAYYAGHPGAVLAQALLVHGIAGLALAVVAMSLPGSTTGPLRRSARAAGLTAAFLSLFQATVSAAATHGARSTAPSQSLAYFHAINMTDFVKLIALAAFVSTTTALVAGPGRLSAFLKTVGRFLLILLPLGGSSFLFPNPVCEAALDLSLVLLLCWTAALGACVRSRQRLTLVLGGC